MDQVVELLSALSSPDASKRKPAEELFQQGKNQPNPDQLLLSFLQALGSPQVEVSLKTQAAVLLRQLVSKTDKAFAFAKCTPANKQGIATELLRLFKDEQTASIQTKIGEVIARLADAVCDSEDNRGWLSGARGWPDALKLSCTMGTQGQTETVMVAGIDLTKSLILPMKDDVPAATAEIGGLIQQGLQSSSLVVKSNVFLLVCEMVGVLEKKDWVQLTATVDVLNSILLQLAQAQKTDELQDCLQGYTEIAEVEPDFFKKTLLEKLEPAQTLAQFVGATEADASLRNMSLEFLVSYAEKKPKWLAKSLPKFAPLALECCMKMMLEVDAEESQVKEWIARMDDEEGEEDADELFHVGEEAIDRIVEAMDFENVSSSLFPLVGKFAEEGAWQCKHAALAAIKQTVEYADEEEHISQMSLLLTKHLDHEHPRVRYTALHAIGQLANDQAPHYQEKNHKAIMPALLKMMDDPIDRVASMAMSAFVSFGEELDTTLMATYATTFMQKLCQKLSTSNHRMIKEESITSIAVIAGVIEKDFSQYYDEIMPVLKKIVSTASGEKENRLRGKAFECMSLLGIAVGKEKFAADAQEAVQAMLQITATSSDDLQREYIKEAAERMCKCFKEDFGPFVKVLLPGILKNLNLQEGPASQDTDPDNFISVSSQGKSVRVHTSKFEELLNSIQLLTTFCSEMEAAFAEFVAPCAQGLLPLLTAQDEVTMLCDEARSAAFQCWALLIKSARKGGNAAAAAEMLKTCLPLVCTTLGSEKDADLIREAADGLSECLKNAGQNCVGQAEFQQIAEMMFKLIDDSLARTDKILKEKQADFAQAGMQQDEDDENNAEDDEEQCRRSLEEVLGALMEVVPDLFVSLLQHCNEKMKLWLTNPLTSTLALFLACDLLQHLKAASKPMWGDIMPKIFASLTDQNADLRIPASYALNLAALIPDFAEAAGEAATRLASILQQPAPKKRKDEKAKVAMDNAVAAMLSLAIHHGDKVPQGAFGMVLSKLPMKGDEEEAKKVHKSLLEQIGKQNAKLCAQENLAQIVKVCAEVHKQENICDKDTDAMIVAFFKQLGAAQLGGIAGGFTEKQQKKIERIVSQ